MTRKTAIPFLAVLCLCSVLLAQEPVSVTDVAVDKLLENVRVTVVCSGNPNVSSYLSADPLALVVDVMGATSKLQQERIESAYYPVSGVKVEQSEAASGLRVTIGLRDPVEHRVTVENGLVVVELGLHPIAPTPVMVSEDQFAGKRLTLYVKDADLTDIIRMIASQFDLNILATQDVKSLVTVRLNDVPLRQGLDALLKAGLANMVVDKQGIIIVKPEKKEMFGETQTRLFPLDYVEAKDIVRVMKKVMSPVGEALAADRRLAAGGGSERSAYVMVSDIPEALERVAEFIAEYDRPIPQIVIEVKFVETMVNASDILGVEWKLGLAARAGAPAVGEDDAFPLIVPNGLLPGLSNAVIGRLDYSGLSAAMDFLQTRGNSRVLASPSTMTLDNHTATISMGTDVPLQELSTDPKTGLVLSTWRTRSVPIALEVTPHVTSDGRVSMRVKPSVEAITGWVGSSDNRQPIVSRRSAESHIVVGDGEVAVIGGLTRDEETKTIGKIPLLGDIPILGHLFRKTTINHTKSELIIFIIPRVVAPQIQTSQRPGKYFVD
ncbi:AMIN domain-containing protein [candidate division WOR-3 bacterium]|uniref:AMIN domain-containing protein n=1 Tax=candidate division WOR-3 bacterium TaxID=2052148 RepID=A0A937XJ16_UNCW3|nr:AMIN domain-containing protein [candidate division WOR-3 bacterium]